jgi:hypothetical protein
MRKSNLCKTDYAHIRILVLQDVLGQKKSAPLRGELAKRRPGLVPAGRRTAKGSSTMDQILCNIKGGQFRSFPSTILVNKNILPMFGIFAGQTGRLPYQIERGALVAQFAYRENR